MKSKSILLTLSMLFILCAVSINCAPAAKTETAAANQVLPVITFFTASPSEIAGGTAATLEWNTSGADYVSIDQGIDEVPVNGKISIMPSATNTFTLTAVNGYGTTSKSVAVKVNPAIKVGNQSAGSSDDNYPIICRDGTCTFVNKDIYCFDYPDSWAIHNGTDADPTKIRLVHKEGGADIMVVMSEPVAAAKLPDIANNYVAKMRTTHDRTFYLYDNAAMEDKWDWYINWSYLLGVDTNYTKVYFKTTDTRLYEIDINYTQAYYDAYNMKGDIDKILSSFKVLY